MEFIPKRVAQYSKEMGLSPKGVAVLELKNRWGSYSAKLFRLNFHWKSLMAPVYIVDYIVVHELAHLKHPRHNAKFWNEIDKVLP